MARKAVQGYTEKSYYDNTKYTGVVATTDPLNEGYFKHLVNFDISDTGQSVTPRKGYLTTSLQDKETLNLITLSKNTIIFKDNHTQEQIIYDFANNSGYVADVSAYRLKEKLLPITRRVAYLDWDDVIDYLLKEVPVVADTMAVIRQAYIEPIQHTLEDLTWPQYEIYKMAYPHSSYTVIRNGDTVATAELAETWLLADTGFSSLTDMVNYHQGDPISIYVDDGLGPSYWQVVQEHISESTARKRLLTHILTNLNIYKDSKIEHIIDLNGISKTLIKVEYIIDPAVYDADGNVTTEANTFPFILEIYYRKDAATVLDTNYAANTLIFNVVDTYNHTTYDPLERNIACAKSIIPPQLQTLHTVATRPAGHVSSVGKFYYVKDNEGNYMINYIYRNKDYTITPFFDLSPAFMVLNNAENSSDGWAYRFDITNTSVDLGLGEGTRDTVFRSPWYRYNGKYQEPTPIFPDVRVDKTYYNEELTDMTLRHVRNCRYIVYALPKYPLTDVTGTTDYEIPQPTGDVQTKALDTYNKWKNAVNKIKSIKTLYDAIKTMEAETDVIFYVYYMGDVPRNYEERGVFDLYANYEYNMMQGIDLHRESSDTQYWSDDYYLTADELIAYLKERNVLSASTGDNVMFKLMPYSATQTTTDSHGITDTVFSFRSLEPWWGDIYPMDVPVFNWYNGHSQYKFYRREGSEYVIGTSIDDLYKSTLLPDLKGDGFFANGINITFYMYPYEQADVTDKAAQDKRGDAYRAYKDYEVMKTAWASSTPYTVPGYTLLHGYDALTVTKIVKELSKEPEDIRDSKTYFVYDDTYLVVWHKNMLYISEPGQHHYFKEASKKEFPERIVKVIQFKTIILVFTVQNLYAVYQTEIPTTVDSPEGPVQSSEIVWAKQTVLYNIMTSDRYADVIQVFNQMVLFYSEDGQLFMIKPSTTIDSETRFSLQYFNKSANDILANYDQYINERLANYNIEQRITKDDVKVKALISVNYIKIFYYVPGVITYILIYDVINNRYTVYDTLTFTDISDKLFVESGELFLTVQNDKLYFTMPYIETNQTDNVVDMSIVSNFKRVAINSLIDTGNLNLNNHLNKRFRDLQVVFKNLSASKLLFNVETVLDDVVSHPYYDTQIQVQDIGGVSYYVSAPKSNENDLIELVDINHVSEVASSAFLYALNNNLFEEGNMLMDFSDFTSSKLLTHRTSILGMGKVFRLKLQFISKGNYKVQSFAIIYKERRV